MKPIKGPVFVRCGTRWWRALERYWDARGKPERMQDTYVSCGRTGRVFGRREIEAALRETARLNHLGMRLR